MNRKASRAIRSDGFHPPNNCAKPLYYWYLDAFRATQPSLANHLEIFISLMFWPEHSFDGLFDSSDATSESVDYDTVFGTHA